MKKKLAVGIILGAILVYLSIRGINFQDVTQGFKTIRYGYVLPVLIIMFIIQVLRSLRWGVILNGANIFCSLIILTSKSIFPYTSNRQKGFLIVLNVKEAHLTHWDVSYSLIKRKTDRFCPECSKKCRSQK